MTEERRTPELRFSEFNKEWAAEKLGNNFEMKSGSFVPAKEIENEPGPNLYPCFGGNGLRGYTKSFTHEGRYNLIGRQGALCGNVNLVDGTFHATEHAVVVENNEKYDIDFVYYILNNLKLNRLATGQAQPGLSISILDSVKFYATKLTEQQKIASFLTAIDKRIQLLQKKKAKLEEYKKGVMQKLFPAKAGQAPEIRFKDENGNDFSDWEEKRLGGILFEHKKRNKQDEFDEVFSVSKAKGVINQIEHLGRSYSADSISNYKLIEPHDIVYTKSPTSDFPFGIIKQNLTNRTGVLSPLYGVFRPENKWLGHLIHSYFLSPVNTYNYLVPLVQKGAKNTMNINNDDFLNGGKIAFPSSELEQQKIVLFLFSLDDRITLVNKQIETSTIFKKGLLQKMFV